MDEVDRSLPRQDSPAETQSFYSRTQGKVSSQLWYHSTCEDSLFRSDVASAVSMPQVTMIAETSTVSPRHNACLPPRRARPTSRLSRKPSPPSLQQPKPNPRMRTVSPPRADAGCRLARRPTLKRRRRLRCLRPRRTQIGAADAQGELRISSPLQTSEC